MLCLPRQSQKQAPLPASRDVPIRAQRRLGWVTPLRWDTLQGKLPHLAPPSPALVPALPADPCFSPRTFTQLLHLLQPDPPLRPTARAPYSPPNRTLHPTETRCPDPSHLSQIDPCPVPLPGHDAANLPLSAPAFLPPPPCVPPPLELISMEAAAQ